MVDLITAIRSLRAEMNIPPATLMPLVLAGVSKETQGRATRWLEFVKRLARVSEVVVRRPRRRKARCNSWCAGRPRRFR